MAIYTQLLADVQSSGSGPILVYQAPEDGITVLRDIVLAVSSASHTGRRLAIYSYSPGGVTAFIHAQPTQLGYSSVHWSGRQVLPFGYGLYAIGDGGDITVRVTGYRLGL